ncbi:MAG: MoxR family ATPase [Verrucomicrobia bacterium]|nr:MoxR family ATPase [Verrucomicrobiota bacterium]
MNPTDLTSLCSRARDELRAEMRKCIVGQDAVVELMFLTLLCNGHVLLLGVPGVAKTLMSAAMAKALQLEFRRVQFTPDMMPADITGAEVLEEDETNKRFRRIVLPGPVFTNILLADEINRTPPKTQASLLQAMQEREVTIGRETHPLKPPFMVLATQNPLESEGTYPLPEAQLDRFFCCVRVEYPTAEEEVSIALNAPASRLGEIKPVLDADRIAAMQQAVRSVPVATDVARYAVRLSGATRPGEGGIADVASYLECGASPRASQALVLAGQARALLEGRAHVDFADVRSVAAPILRHRLVLNFRARAERVEADQLVERVLEKVKPA